MKAYSIITLLVMIAMSLLITLATTERVRADEINPQLAQALQGLNESIPLITNEELASIVQENKNKLVVINMFSITQYSSLPQLANLKKVYKTLEENGQADKVAFVGLTDFMNEFQLNATKSIFDITYQVGKITPALQQSYLLSYYPSLIIIRNGEIKTYKRGFLSPNLLYMLINKEIKKLS